VPSETPDYEDLTHLVDDEGELPTRDELIEGVVLDQASLTTRVMTQEAHVAGRVMCLLDVCDKMLATLGEEGASLEGEGSPTRGALVRQVLMVKSLVHDIERVLGSGSGSRGVPPPLPGVRKP
jgi:hypothetical protein